MKPHLKMICSALPDDFSKYFPEILKWFLRINNDFQNFATNFTFMVLEDSQIFHLQFLKIEDYIQNFCHKFHIHNFYEPYTELRSEKFIFSIYSSIFHSQSWKTACFPALGQENRFSDLQTMNFFFSAWNENSTIIKEIFVHTASVNALS